jgi:hypothetical protein
MKPIDYRNQTWKDIRDLMTGTRVLVWQAFKQFGPATTRAVADQCGIDILTLRPRATELYQLGFLRLHGDEPGAEGTYAACTPEEAMETFQANVRAARDPQLEITGITNQLP